MDTSITRVVIDSFTPQTSGTCAEVSVVINDALAIHKISVISGERGLFVAMPNTGQTKMSKNGKRFSDIVHPLNKDLASQISDAVLNAYNAKLKSK